MSLFLRIYACSLYHVQFYDFSKDNAMMEEKDIITSFIIVDYHFNWQLARFPTA